MTTDRKQIGWAALRIERRAPASPMRKSTKPKRIPWSALPVRQKKLSNQALAARLGCTAEAVRWARARYFPAHPNPTPHGGPRGGGRPPKKKSPAR